MLKALGSGLVGAFTLMLVHETARRFIDDAPRMDVVGMRAITKAVQAAGGEAPGPLHEAALGGDIVTNSLWSGLVGLGSREDGLRNGAILGLAAGLGAVFLPEPLGLGQQPTEDSPQTELMTVAWYLVGGPGAGAAYNALGSAEHE